MSFQKIIMGMVLLLVASSFKADVRITEKYRSLLWKIEGKNNKTSYLFGTIHMIPASKFQISDKTAKALSQSDVLMLEIDITAQGVMTEMMRYSQMGGGQRLDEFLNEKQLRKVDSTLKVEAGMGIQAMMTFKPFVIESFLIQKLIEGEAASCETLLAELAKKKGIPVVSLETVKEQMAIFDSVPYKEQVDDLMKFIDFEENMRLMFADMVEMYLKEDLQALNKLMHHYYADPKFLKYLLYDRNERWIIRMEEQMEEQSVFIAVGAGHLPGNRGLISLLRQWGYKVTPVK